MTLKPCPFCGSPAEIERYGTNRASMIIACTACGCRLETGETWIDDNSQWNKQAGDEAMSILRDIQALYDLEEPDDNRDCVNRITKLLSS